MQTLYSDSISFFLLYSIFFSGCQALLCRGNWVSESEFDSHYHQLMLSRADDDSSVADWIEKQQFMSPRIQNEMVEINRILLMKQIVRE